MHFIIIGPEDIKLHLAGIKEKGADEVILIDTGIEKKKKDLLRALESFGILARVIQSHNNAPIVSYPALFNALTSEPVEFFGYDVSVIINYSTGNPELYVALMDYLQMEYYKHHQRNSGSPASLSRMIVCKEENATLCCRYFPVWDFTDSTHNAIIGNLISSSKPFDRKQLLGRLELQGIEIGEESFRKDIRDVKNHISRAPNYVEETKHKAPKFGLSYKK